jgi:hypothetical protein
VNPGLSQAFLAPFDKLTHRDFLIQTGDHNAHLGRPRFAARRDQVFDQRVITHRLILTAGRWSVAISTALNAGTLRVH